MNKAEILAALAERRDILESLDDDSEADTRSMLIEPVLDWLGYPADFRRSERQDRGNCPDEILYSKRVDLCDSGSSALIVLEAKPFGADFDRPSKGRVDAPKRQIRRYLCSHAAAGEGSYGVLTDGGRWYVLRRTGFRNAVESVADIDIFSGDLSGNLDVLHDILSCENLVAASRPAKRSKLRESALSVISAVASGEPPVEIVNLLAPERQVQHLIKDEIGLSGKAADAEQNDWEATDWDWGCEILDERQSLTNSMSGRSVIAAVRFRSSSDSDGLSRQDTDLAAKTFAKLSGAKVSVTIAYLKRAGREETLARVAVHAAGRTAMTVEFDADLVPDRVIDSLAELKKLLASSEPQTASSLAEPVTVKKIREEFYEAVAKWVQDKQHLSGQGRKGDEAVLRHLIRVVFAWILKENGLCNPNIFEEYFAAAHRGSYHSDVLAFLFYERFNKPKDDREEADSSEITSAMADVPFLNGSVFAKRKEDALLDVSMDEYFSVDSDSPGLFTILSRYDWSMSEHTVSVNEQTIDGEILSHLFENLAVTSLSGNTPPKKMDKGTYYTPSDVSTEMAKDALSAAVKPKLPSTFPKDSLLDLFGDPHFETPEMPEEDLSSLRDTIRSLSVLDPAVGSGAFLLVTANAIATALRNLGDTRKDMLRSIAQTQLHGLDVTPMAVQITRLRTFIAIMSDERNHGNLNALPNLEARIVCADTLATIADPGWRPDRTGQLVDSDPDIEKALADVAATQEEWLEAHTEMQKANVQTKDQLARDTLTAELEAANWDRDIYPEIWNFAKHKIFDTDAGISKADARLIFYRQGLEGFDIVIGNPPYVKAEDIDKEKLAEKSYTTGKGGDLYNFFCETALTLVKPQGGAVCLVVPHSLSFAEKQTATRQLFEAASSEIWLRHQDNRPDRTFGESHVKNSENRQRTTIITALTGDTLQEIRTSGMARWLSAEREAYFKSRNLVLTPDAFRESGTANLIKKLDCQWPRLPSKKVTYLIAEMCQQKTIFKDLCVPASKWKIGFPNTVYNFISVLPAAKLGRIESVLSVDNCHSFSLAMAVFNSHLFYAWWRIWSDAFNLRKYQIESMPIPDAWLQDSKINSEAKNIGNMLQKLLDSPDNITESKSGSKGKLIYNINFHEVDPNLIEQTDRLYLKALKIESAEADSMLEELRKLRSNSNWRQ